MKLDSDTRRQKLNILKDYFSQLIFLKQVRLPGNNKLDYSILGKQGGYSEEDLPALENLHNVLETYLWLANKFEEEFIEKEKAVILIKHVCKLIDDILMEGKEFTFIKNIE